MPQITRWLLLDSIVIPLEQGLRPFLYFLSSSVTLDSIVIPLEQELRQVRHAVLSLNKDSIVIPLEQGLRHIFATLLCEEL